MNNITLFGFKGCGKSYFGKLFSKTTGCLWLDSDHLLEKKYQSSCRDIYKEVGCDEFRIREANIISSLREVKQCIISLGGGAILYEENRKLLEKMSILVYLQEDREKLKHRMLSGLMPALFLENDPEKEFEIMYQERLPIYENILAHKISLCTHDEKEVVAQLKELMYG